MIKKATLLLSLDIPTVVLITNHQFDSEQICYGVYYLPVLFCILSSLQVYSLRNVQYSMQIRTAATLGKLVLIWISFGEAEFTSIYYSCLFQQIFQTNNSGKQLQIPIYLTITAILSQYPYLVVFQWGLPQAMIIIQISTEVTWILFFARQQRKLDRQLITKDFTLTNCLPHQQIMASTLRKYSPSNPSPIELNWFYNMNWLSEENIIVLNCDYTMLYCSFNIPQFLNMQDQPQFIVVEKILNGQVKLQKKQGASQKQFVIQGSLMLRQLIDHIINQTESDSKFATASFQDSNIGVQNYFMNIFMNRFNNEQCVVIHFQQIPPEYNQNQNLIDICRSISHELGTCLNCITSLSTIALLSNEMKESIKTDFLQPISISSQQLNLIISNIRDYSAIAINQFDLKLSQFNVYDEIACVLSYFTDVCFAKNITIDFKQNNSIVINLSIVLIFSDKDRFRQVVYQLLSNAFRFTETGTITIQYYMDDQYLVTNIIDTGIGMTDEEQIYAQSILKGNTLTRVSENSIGSGLGLYISNLIVQKLSLVPNKTIEFTSVANQGSSFRFQTKDMQTALDCISVIRSNDRSSSSKKSIIRMNNFGSYYENSLPFYSERQMLQPNQKVMLSHYSYQQESGSIQSIQMQGEVEKQMTNLPSRTPKFQNEIRKYSLRSTCCSRVLIVDDEYFNIKSLEALMRPYHTICDSAYNGSQAIDKIKYKLKNHCESCYNIGYSIVFLDINMPIMGGIETVKMIKLMMSDKVIPKVTCIANTGFSDLETKIISYEAGMDYFLTKPICNKQLSAVIQLLFPSE